VILLSTVENNNLIKTEISTDKLGVLYFDGKYFYRKIFNSQRNNVIEIINHSFFKEIVGKNIFVETSVCESKNNEDNLYIKHNNLEPLCLPYEWSPIKLKRMAFRVLTLIKNADKYNYSILDPHVNNVAQSIQGYTYIDFGSISQSNKIQIKQKSLSIFYNNFIFPLELMQKGYYELARNLFLRRTEFPIEEMLNLKYLHYPFFIKHIFYKINYILEKVFKLSNDQLHTRIPIKWVNQFIINKISPFYYSYKINKYLKLLNNFKYRDYSKWANYQTVAKDINRFDTYIIEAKELGSFSTIVDLACNAGVFSNKAINDKLTQVAYAVDIDTNALEELEHKANPNILSFYSDIMRPDARKYDKDIRERIKSECVFALAITHHLFLSQNYNWDSIIEAFRSFTKKYLFVEYMPKGIYDGSHSNNNPLPEEYQEKYFKVALENKFSILKTINSGSDRVLYICELKVKE
jgi:hypothetical protein